MTSTSIVRWIALALAVLPATVAAQNAVGLTNQDVANLVRAGLSPGMVASVISRAPVVTFDLSTAGLIALKTDGVSERIIEVMLEADRKGRETEAYNSGARSAPDRSRLLAESKTPESILQNARTLYVFVDAVFFTAAQMKAALGETKGFARLALTIVDDPGVADLILEVRYTPLWDYPFALTHQNTSMVLLSGTGEGPFSGPLGAISVAESVVKQLKPYRATARSDK